MGVSSRTYAIVLIGLATAPFYYSGTYGDTYIDENFAIARNQDVMESRWRDIWTHDFWGWTLTPDEEHWTSKSYRPLVTLSFSLQVYAGHTMGMMRIVNCLLHTFNSMLVYALVGNLLAALTFALHPVHVENIVYLVGRADALATTFFLVAMLYVKQEGKARSKFACVAVCTVAAGLSKETGFTLPILVAFRLLRADRFAQASLYLIYVAIVFLIRSWFVGGSDVGFSYIDTPIRYQDSIVHRTLSYLMLHATYMQLMVAPFHQSWDYSFDALPIVRSFTDLRLLGVAASYLALALLVVLGARRQRCLLDGAIWVTIPFVPASNLFFLVGTTVGERLLYPCTVGWALVLTRVRPLAALCVVWYAYRSAVRLYDWQTPGRLFLSDSMHWDRSAKVLHQRGVIERGLGRPSEALAFFNRSLEVFDDNALTDFMIAQIHLDLGNCDRALAQFHKINDGNGIGFGDHNHALLVTEFAFTETCSQNFAQAVGLFETERAYTLQTPHLANAYALALNMQGSKQMALDVLQDVVEAFPHHASSWTNLGTLCAINGFHECFTMSYRRAEELVETEQKLELATSIRGNSPIQWVFFRD